MRMPPMKRPFMSIPLFGLFSFLVVFIFSLAFLSFLQPEAWKDPPLRQAGELSGQQVVFFLSLSASIAAALSGMLVWTLLIVLPWQWLTVKSSRITALFGSLIGLIEIISTACLMWMVYDFFLLATLPPPDISTLLTVFNPLAIIVLGIFTLAIVIIESKGIIFLVAIVASMLFTLLARRISVERHASS